MNTLTIFSPRTGSTILNELLSFQYKNLDLDEFVSGALRKGTLHEYVRNIPQSVRDEIKQVLKTDASFSLSRRRVDYVLRLEHNWSAKCLVMKDVELTEYFIQNALKQNTKIFYTCRKDVKAQCWSMIMGRIRSKKIYNAKEKERLAYVSTIKYPYPDIVPSAFDGNEAKEIANAIISAGINVKSLYERFGGTLVVYEDTIQKQDFSSCDITEETIRSYSKLKQRLEKPPTILPEQYVTNWKEIDEMIETMVI